MGSWALPNTKQKAEELKKLLAKPLYSNKRTQDKLYHLYGDDALFDAIDDREYEYGKHYDIRFLIKIYIKGLLEDYKKHSETFNVNFDKGALKILNELVKDIL